MYTEYTIYDAALNKLFGDGLVLDSCANSQETETDKIPVELEISPSTGQGGPIGTNVLVEESHLGPLNLNNEKVDERQINNILPTNIEGTKENSIPWPA